MLVQPTTREVIQVGNVVFTDLDNLICLIGSASGAADRYSTLRKTTVPGAVYQVPSGKTFYVRAVSIWVFTASAGQQISILYGDNDVGQNVAGAPTNAVYPGGVNTQASAVTTLGPYERAMLWQVPA